MSLTDESKNDFVWKFNASLASIDSNNMPSKQLEEYCEFRLEEISFSGLLVLYGMQIVLKTCTLEGRWQKETKNNNNGRRIWNFQIRISGITKLLHYVKLYSRLKGAIKKKETTCVKHHNR